MRKFVVSLEIRTTQVSVKELVNLSGLQLSPSSHNAGDIGGDGRPFAMTVGVFEPEIETGDLNTLMQRMLDKLDFVQLKELRKKVSDATVVISIGVFFDTANCSFEISADHAALLGTSDIRTSISCYPAYFEPE